MNHYEVLSVAATASYSEIKAAYRRLVKKYHPDINPAPSAADQMVKINEAYEVLSNNTTRNLYDLFLKGVPVKTDIKKSSPAQKYREEYLAKKARQDRDRIIFLVKIKTRFYRYQRMANMLFFTLGLLFTIDYYFQPNQQIVKIEEIRSGRFETLVVTKEGYRFSTSKEMYRSYVRRGTDEILIKFSWLFNSPARVQVIDRSVDYIVNGSIYVYRNAFSIIILLFSAVVVKNKEYTDFRLSCGLVPAFFVLFLLLFIVSEL